MLAPGDAVPPARVWDTSRRPLDLRELAAEGPYLLLFYLLDWSGT
jgi:hypothetical protein